MTQCDFERTGSVLKPYIRLTTIQFKLVSFLDVDKKKFNQNGPWDLGKFFVAHNGKI